MASWSGMAVLPACTGKCKDVELGMSYSLSNRPSASSGPATGRTQWCLILLFLRPGSHCFKTGATSSRPCSVQIPIAGPVSEVISRVSFAWGNL